MPLPMRGGRFAMKSEFIPRIEGWNCSQRFRSLFVILDPRIDRQVISQQYSSVAWRSKGVMRGLFPEPGQAVWLPVANRDASPT